VAPTTEPLVPGSLRLFDDEKKTSEVAAHTEVVEVTLDAPRERCVLFLDRLVSVAMTPIVDRLNRPS
jgi:hypothetical protein